MVQAAELLSIASKAFLFDASARGLDALVSFEIAKSYTPVRTRIPEYEAIFAIAGSNIFNKGFAVVSDFNLVSIGTNPLLPYVAVPN